MYDGRASNMQKEPSLRQQLGAADLQSGCDFSAWRKFDLQPTLACFDILTWGNEMVLLRILGGCLIAWGLLFSITIIGAAIGVPMMLLGVLFLVVSQKRTPIIIRINNDHRK